MENPIKMDDFGVPLFLETPMYFRKNRTNTHWPPLKPEIPSFLRGLNSVRWRRGDVLNDGKEGNATH